MAVTGIELGPDYCVLVHARRHPDARVELRAVWELDAADWPPTESALTELIRDARLTNRFPRKAHVVLWPPRGAQPGIGLRCIRAAGFEIVGVTSPIEGLRAIARAAPRATLAGPQAWLAINTHGAAIAVVRGGTLLCSHMFDWSIRAPRERTQAHLLRRYLSVAQLAAELRRAIETVRQQHGLTIDAAITCGNLPDLRSLTLPLIEELDLEVETLDSMEGLTVRGERAAQVADRAAAVRVATAAALTAPRRARALATWWRAAAVVALASAALLWAVFHWRMASPTRLRGAAPQQSAPARESQDAPQPPEAMGTAATAGVTEPEPPTPLSEIAPGPAIEPSAPGDTRSALGRVADERALTSSRPARDQSEGSAGGVPLSAPLPRVDGILISSNRRLAIVDGVVVGRGDAVGPRIVVRIDADGIVLREPSGHEVRLIVRRKPGTGTVSVP